MEGFNWAVVGPFVLRWRALRGLQRSRAMIKGHGEQRSVPPDGRASRRLPHFNDRSSEAAF